MWISLIKKNGVCPGIQVSTTITSCVSSRSDGISPMFLSVCHFVYILIAKSFEVQTQKLRWGLTITKCRT